MAHSRVARFWLRELPYIAVLTVTILGVAYTSVSHQPLIGYWEFLAVATGLVCVTTGWLHIHDPKARFRMVWTQALHWLSRISMVIGDARAKLSESERFFRLRCVNAMPAIVIDAFPSYFTSTVPNIPASR